MKYIPIKNGKGEITGFTVGGENYTLKKPMIEKEFIAKIGHGSVVDLSDNTWFAFNSAGGSASTTGTDTSFLQYFLVINKLLQGTELTEADDSIPDVNNNKGFLTSSTETALLDFYKVFGYNDENYKLMTTNRNIEVSFLCSDRRYGVAGSRRAWSPYFKIRDLEKTTFTLIQNDLVGSDLTASYNIQGKITRNAAGVLFITLTDTHAGSNLFGAVLNIRHRIV